MSYCGFILRRDLMDGERTGQTIKAALTAIYEHGRFLGVFDWTGSHGRYVDLSIGDVVHFKGRETILVQGV